MSKKSATPKTATVKARRWCFTWNNYTDEVIESLKTVCPDRADYLMYGTEIGESGTPHLQGYVEFGSPLAISTVKSRLDPKLKGKSPIHVETCKGSQEQNINYCSKDGNVVEYGQSKEQGSRNGWNTLYDFVQANPDMDLVAKAYPEAAIRYWNGLEKLVKQAQIRARTEALSQQYQNVELRKWQLLLLETLKGVPNDRTVHWFYDTKGNVGKSWMCKYMKYLYPQDCALLSNGKSTDIAHMYNCERIAIFDFARSCEERINYQIIEQIKDGKVFSPKYDSHTKVCVCPHVVCFANFEPERGALSQDRWNIVNITDIEGTEALNTELQKYTDIL